MAILFKLSKQTEKIIAHRLTKNGKIEINRKGNQIGQKFFFEKWLCHCLINFTTKHWLNY
jgi:hypothetical protein